MEVSVTWLIPGSYLAPMEVAVILLLPGFHGSVRDLDHARIIPGSHASACDLAHTWLIYVSHGSVRDLSHTWLPWKCPLPCSYLAPMEVSVTWLTLSSLPSPPGGETSTAYKVQYHFYYCAADFSLLNLPKGKSLGRSKPATSSYAQAPQHTVWDDFYYI